MASCRHIKTGATQSSLSCLDKVQNCFHFLVLENFFSTLQPLSHGCSIASQSLLHHHSHGNCSDEIQMFSSTHSCLYGQDTPCHFHGSNHLYFHYIPNGRRQPFPNKCYFLKQTHSWVASLNTNLDLFNSMVNYYISSRNFHFQSHLTRHYTFNCNPLL